MPDSGPVLGWVTRDWASSEVQVLLRPRTTFAALARSPDEGPRRLAARVALQLLVLGCAVSLTTAGRLVPWHVVSGFVAWSFIPAIQLIGASIGVHVARRGLDLRRVLSIYSAGNGPWLVVFTVIPAAMVLWPGTALSFWIERGVLPFVIGAALLFGVWLTYLFHRTVLEVGARRAIVATCVDLVVKVALSLAWFQAMDNLIPQLLGPGT